MLDRAHVAGRLLSNQDVPPCESSLSLSALPFRRPVSVGAVVGVATAAGTGRKWDGLGVLTCLGGVSVRPDRLSSRSASATNGAPTSPFLAPASSRSVTGGCFPDVLTGLEATTDVAVAFAVRVDGWWKSSSEHERAGVLKKAEQTKRIAAGLSSYIIRQHSSGGA